MSSAAKVATGILFCLACLGGLSCRKPNEFHDMLHIDRASNNTEQNLRVGQEIEVRLAENPTTGFRWELQEAASSVLNRVSDTFERLTSSGEVGKAGVRVWRFNAVREGS